MKYVFSFLSAAVIIFSSSFVDKSITNHSNENLSANEKAGLIKMREEEKLAYEVYTFLDEKWDHQVFKNIKQSEFRHMEMIKSLLDKFELQDPYIDQMGKYNDVPMQQLYDHLTVKGSVSLQEAFIVGATIEDLDIADLEQLIIETTNSDIKDVYEILNSGSRNHIRAFTKQLSKMQVTYTPQYITQEKYTNIINGSHENGCAKDNGNSCNKGNGCQGKSSKACVGSYNGNRGKQSSCKH
ncbi:MAG: DUF2202 domain-containing protein [Saprospiraceae bacterium]